jgi:hypothetical protein
MSIANGPNSYCYEPKILKEYDKSNKKNADTNVYITSIRSTSNIETSVEISGSTSFS